MDVKRIEAIAPWTSRGGLSKLFSYPFFQKFRILLPSFLLSFVQSIDGSIFRSGEEETSETDREKKREPTKFTLSE